MRSASSATQNPKLNKTNNDYFAAEVHDKL